MTRLVEDLLTLARVDSGQAQLHLEPVDVSRLVASTCEDLQALAATRGGRLDAQCEPSVEALVDGDRIRQVLVILVDNALRHGRQGGSVGVRFDRAGQEMRFEISDNGPGIPADQKDRVFERFYQLDASRSGSGAGLGLAIARWIVVAHGGAIKLADNEPGLIVRISIPIRDSGEHAARSSPHRETPTARVDRGTDGPWWRAASRR